MSLFTNEAKQCVFKDTDNKHILDLSWYMNQPGLYWGQQEPYNYFHYTPCKNGETSCIHNAGQIIQQHDPNNTDYCYIVSIWNNYASEVTPKYSNKTETWSFYYNNGDSGHCSTGKRRAITIHWHCNMNKSEIINVTEPEICIYEMYIESKWACLGQRTDQESENMDIIWFIIILCGALGGFLIILVVVIVIKKKCAMRRQTEVLIEAGVNVGMTHGSTMSGFTTIIGK